MYGPFLTVPDAQKLAGLFVVSVWKCLCVCVHYSWASVIVQHLCVFRDKVMADVHMRKKAVLSLKHKRWEKPLNQWKYFTLRTSQNLITTATSYNLDLTQHWAFKRKKTSLSSLTSSCVNVLLCHVCAIVCWTHKDWIEMKILIILPNVCTAFTFTFSHLADAFIQSNL